MSHRLVVVGRRDDGTSYVVEDRLLEADVLAPRGNRLTTLWYSEGTPSIGQPVPGVVPQEFLPPPGGWRLAVLSYNPDHAGLLPAGEGTVLSDLASAMQHGGGGGMHTTPTVDVVHLLDGELVLELDDGVEVELRPGDTVVQQAARHGWRNRTDRAARILLFMAGALTPGE